MKIIVYFLPQFYATPENDKFWGKGFTDWENVRSANPMFKKHRQPLKPANGYYDLSNIKGLKMHSDLSANYGIDGFGYWHYWFGNGYKTLEKVPEMHLSEPEIKQNFFFAWANTNWTKSWVGDDKTVIFEQVYSKKSAINHFEYLKPFLEDYRYIRVNGLPLFQVLNPDTIGVKQHIKILEEQAKITFGHGFHWLFPINRNTDDLKELVYSKVGFPPGDVTVNNYTFKVKRYLQKKGLWKDIIIISREAYLKSFKKTVSEAFEHEKSYYPCLLSGWDNTPRYKKQGFLIQSDISSILENQFDVLKEILHEKNKKCEILFLKAWNEWAEGNILEPYQFQDKIYNPLEIVKDVKKNWFCE